MHVLVAAAWPYASGPRHLGHLAGAFLPADVIARASRLLGHDVLFVSGSDEHGTPITIAAERAGTGVREFAAGQHAAIERSLRDAGISFDHYGRTSSAVHRRVVHDLFRQLHTAGSIVEGEQRGAWCGNERRALPDRYVEGRCPHCDAPDARGDQCDACGALLDADELRDPRCRLCAGAATLRPQRQLFLRLDALQPAIEDWLPGSSRGWRRWVAEEAAGALRGGLRPRAITRELEWGIDVPLDGWHDRVLYVWFEAVVGYLSSSVEWAESTGDRDAWRAWWEDAESVHRYAIGKDNVWFHALWWPAILAGAGGLHLPDDVVGSHNLTERGQQLSVSRDHGTSIADGIDRLGVDALRHALVAVAPETSDVDFTWEAADDATRAGLLGAIANPAHRVTTQLARRFEGRIDATVWAGALGVAERRDAAAAADAAVRAFSTGSLRAGLRAVHDIGRRVNRTLAAREPWAQPEAEAHETLTLVAPWLDALAVASSPVVPGVGARLRAALGRPPLEGLRTARLPSDPPLVPADPPTPLPSGSRTQRWR
ncbi:MAG TPA: methionine--tRNA ligase [Acidimicrobiales bacterium]